MKTSTFERVFSKNTIYHFLNDARFNWQCFTMLLSTEIICLFMRPLIDEKHKDVFIVDGSHSLLLAAEDKNLFCTSKRYNKRSLAVRRHCQSRRKVMDVMVELIHSAQCAGIPAKLVFIRNKSKRKDWLVLVSTNTFIFEGEIDSELYCDYGWKAVLMAKPGWDIKLKKDLINLIDSQEDIEKLFHKVSGNFMSETEEIHDVQEFQDWLMEIKVELQDIYDRFHDSICVGNY